MKTYIQKFIICVLFVTALFLFVGCSMGENGELPVTLSDEEIVINTLNSINVTYKEGDSAESVTGDIQLGVTLANEACKITWTSNNVEIINIDGKVNQPDEDTVVKITLTVEYNETTLTKTINITVKAKGTDTPKVDKEITIANILALDVKSGETTTEEYVVRGEIKSFSSNIYGNCVISDGTYNLDIYGMSDANGNRYDAMEDKPQVGDTVVLKGVVNNFNGTYELKNTTVLEIIKSEEPPVVEEAIQISIEDMLKLEVATGTTTTQLYEVSGTIISFTNTQYGNCYISDGTNNILVYGLYDENGNDYSTMDPQPEVGQKITVEGYVKNYKEVLEVVSAVVTKIEEGEEITIQEKTIQEVLATSAGSMVKTKGVVIGTYTRGFIIQDATGYMLTYMNTKAFTYVKGDIVTIEGVLVAHHNSVQFDSTCTITKTGTQDYIDPQPNTLDSKNIDQAIADEKMGEYVEVTGKLSISADYYNITLDGTDKLVAISYPDASFKLSSMADLKVKIEGYIIDASSDATRINIMLVKAECLEEIKLASLPQTYDFARTQKGDATLPTGWTWTKSNSDGSYAGAFYQSFRKDGHGVQSPIFNAVNGIKVTYHYYVNNNAAGSSSIKVTAYNANGDIVNTVTSDNISVNDAKLTGVANAKDLELTITGENISYITITFVKDGGGNIAFNSIKLEALSN